MKLTEHDFQCLMLSLLSHANAQTKYILLTTVGHVFNLRQVLSIWRVAESCQVFAAHAQ